MGAGKMGSFFSDLLSFDHEVALFDTNPRRMRFMFNAQRLLTLDEVREFVPEMVINATTVSHTLDAFEMVLPYLPSGCMLADIASVKSTLPEFYASKGHPFVSTHPMFGPTFANLDNLSHQNAIIISEGSDLGKAFFRDLYRKLHLNVVEATFAEHDRLMSYSLTVPFATTLGFAQVAGNEPAPGTTFARHQAIACGVLGEDDNLIVEILLNPHSPERLSALIANLETLRDTIAASDREGLRNLIAQARAQLK